MKISFFRYEGPRTAEALAEFVNTEGGTAFFSFCQQLLSIRVVHHLMIMLYSVA